MTALLDTALFLLILSCFLILGSSRLGACIKFISLQGIVVGLLPILEDGSSLTARGCAFGICTIALKGFIFPALLMRAMREIKIQRELRPFVGNIPSLLSGIPVLLFSIWIAGKLNITEHIGSSLIVPQAIFMIITGLFLIISRRIAISQVIGFLVLENGIYVLGTAIARNIPALIEIGVLIDVFVGVFVMGIAIYHINREFDHIDVDRLNTLKG